MCRFFIRRPESTASRRAVSRNGAFRGVDPAAILRRESGFTIIELLIVMAITTIIMGTLVGIFTYAGQASNKIDLSADAQMAANETEQQLELRTRNVSSYSLFDPSAAGAVVSYPYFSADTASAGLITNTSTDGVHVTTSEYKVVGSSLMNMVLAFKHDAAPNQVDLTITMKRKSDGQTLYVLNTTLYFQNIAATPTMSDTASYPCMSFVS